MPYMAGISQSTIGQASGSRDNANNTKIKILTFNVPSRSFSDTFERFLRISNFIPEKDYSGGKKDLLI